MTDAATPLRTHAARRALIAPDLERYLDPANVDLMVTDQVQAIRVRVERGLEVFQSRLRGARGALRRSLGAGASLLLVCALIAYVTARDDYWFVAGVATVGVLRALWVLPRAGLDLLRIERLSGRFSRDDLQGLETSREILDYGETVLAEARALGAIPG